MNFKNMNFKNMEIQNDQNFKNGILEHAVERQEWMSKIIATPRIMVKVYDATGNMTQLLAINGWNEYSYLPL